MTREDHLIRQLKKGKQECLDELIALTYPAVLRYCLWHMPDRESAQDAAQETFLKLVRFIGQYEHRGHFRAYLYRIAANTCTDMLRRIPPETALSEEISARLCYSEKELQAAEDRQQLAHALACLDNGSREILLLRYGQELTLREIAVVTGLPLRTVQTRLRRTLDRLRQTLAAEEKGGRTPHEHKTSHKESSA